MLSELDRVPLLAHFFFLLSTAWAFSELFFFYFLHGNDYEDTPLLYHLLLKLVGSAWDGRDGFMGLGFLRRWRFSVYTHCMNSHM